MLHDLRLRDPEPPEQTGNAGRCQIDHLFIHRWGMLSLPIRLRHALHDLPFGRRQVERAPAASQPVGGLRSREPDILMMFDTGTIIDGPTRPPSRLCPTSFEPPGPRATCPLLPPTTVCQYPARLRLHALGPEAGRFQIAYGASPLRRRDGGHRDACLSGLKDPR